MTVAGFSEVEVGAVREAARPVDETQDNPPRR
jgi:hypothetical protein